MPGYLPRWKELGLDTALEYVPLTSSPVDDDVEIIDRTTTKTTNPLLVITSDDHDAPVTFTGRVSAESGSSNKEEEDRYYKISPYVLVKVNTEAADGSARLSCKFRLQTNKQVNM